MSKQLTVSATLSVLAMGLLALVTSFGKDESGDPHGAVARGSLISVLLRA